MNENKYIQLFEDGELFSYIDDLQKERNQFKEYTNYNYEKAIKYKEVIDKAIEYIENHKRKDEFLELNEWGTRDLLDILKEVE